MVIGALPITVILLAVEVKDCPSSTKIIPSPVTIVPRPSFQAPVFHSYRDQPNPKLSSVLA